MNHRRLLTTLSSADYNISEKDVKSDYWSIATGTCVVLVTLLCLVASVSAFWGLFKNLFITLPITVAFVWMIANIYLLLLYTLASNPLPSAVSKGQRWTSDAIRIGFICFMALAVSKPIETHFFQEALIEDIAQYRKKQVQEYEKRTVDYFLRSHLVVDQSKAVLSMDELKEIDTRVAGMRELSDKSEFYIYGMIHMCKNYPSCWIITMFSALIFLSPLLLKIGFEKTGSYSEKRKIIEQHVVTSEYDKFRIGYKQILERKSCTLDNYLLTTCGLQSSGFDLQWTVLKSHLYSDPPFNTKDKDREAKRENEESLINLIYAGEQDTKG
jgi:Domain of unknown function (DUF4407)